MSLIDRVSTMIGRNGRTVTVKHISGNAYNTTTGENVKTVTNYEVMANVRYYTAKQINGLVQQGDCEVRIAAADIAVDPVDQDQIVIDGVTTTVMAVNKRVVGNVPAIYIIQVRG